MAVKLDNLLMLKAVSLIPKDKIRGLVDNVMSLNVGVSVTIRL